MAFPLFDVSITNSNSNDSFTSFEKLSSLIKKNGIYLPEALKCLTFSGIHDLAISQKHIAFHSKDGRIARISYVFKPEQIQENDQKESPCVASSSNVNNSTDETDSTAQEVGTGSAYGRLMGQHPFLNARTMRSLNFIRDMHRSGIYLARTPGRQIPAAEVPEHLIDQAMAVLQGKSRQVIVRELQRTNLDVNMAVNNLLSREDDNDPAGSSGLPVVAGGIDLDDWDEDVDDAIFSLFDSAEESTGFDSTSAAEEYLLARQRRQPSNHGSSSNSSHARFFCTMQNRSRKRRCLVYDETQYVLRPSSGRQSGKIDPKDPNHGSDPTLEAKPVGLEFGDDLEFWCDLSQPHRPHLYFSHMGTLHSELVAVKKDSGELCQWRWDASEPYFCQAQTNEFVEPITPVIYWHPRAFDLDLCFGSSDEDNKERIIHLATSRLRATVLTNRGRLATWVDDKIASIAGAKLEHSATHFTALGKETVYHIAVSSLTSTAFCDSGAIFYWGVIPPQLRSQSKSSEERRNNGQHGNSVKGGSNSTSTTGLSPDSPALVPGVFVCMKNAPLYHSGAVGFTVKDGIPKLGTLQEDAWHTNDVCRFRVKTCDQLHQEKKQNSCPPGAISTTHALFDPMFHMQVCPAYLADSYNISSAPTTSMASSQNYSNATNSVSNNILSAASNTGLMYALMVSGEGSCSSRGPGSSCGGSDAGDIISSKCEMMPPPPSPASSTCSDHSGQIKRKKGTSSNVYRAPSSERDLTSSTIHNQRSHSASLGGSSVIHHPPTLLPTVSPAAEEDWCLNDVIFLEDGRSQPVGFVLKIDSGVAAVKFLKEGERACLLTGCPKAPPIGVQFIQRLTDSESLNVISNQSLRLTTAQENLEWFQDIRLIRKEELIVVKNAASVRSVDFVQEKPCLVTSFKSQPILGAWSGNDVIHILTTPSQQSVLPMAQRSVEIQSWTFDGHIIRSHRFPPSMALLLDNKMEDLSNGSLRLPLKLKGLEPIKGFYTEFNSGASQDNKSNLPKLPEFMWDGNGCIYPFLHPRNSSTEAIAPPSWLDLPPISALDVLTIRLPNDRSGSLLNTRRATPIRESANYVRIMIAAVDSPFIMHHILRSDFRQVQKMLQNLRCHFEADQARASGDNMYALGVKEAIIKERIDGGRNLVHAAVAMCAPLSNREAEWTASIREEVFSQMRSDVIKRPSSGSSQPTKSSVLLIYENAPTTEEIKRSGSNQSGNLSYLKSLYSNDVMSKYMVIETPTLGAYFWALRETNISDKDRRTQGHKLLRCLFESEFCVFTYEDIISLLQHRDASGQTPFQYVVSLKAYLAAEHLLNIVLAFHSEWSEARGKIDTIIYCRPNYPISPASNMIFPSNSNVDDSPLIRLCYNNPCTFVWTGKSHIVQYIFECRTCDLTETLCCCWECARTCHRGHDCRLKRRSSPNAYCDCWQNTGFKCMCLVSGDTKVRLELLDSLLKFTDLVLLPNGRGEHILNYLLVAHERLERESRPVVRRRHISDISGASNSTILRRRAGSPKRPSTPEHNLPPPNFDREAIDTCLRSTHALESMLMWGVKSYKPIWLSSSSLMSSNEFHPERNLKECPRNQVRLNYQSGSFELDRFVYGIVTKLSEPTASIEIMLSTVRTLPTKRARSHNSDSTNRLCAVDRLIRSVIRVYTSLSMAEKPDVAKETAVFNKRRMWKRPTRSVRPDPGRLCISILFGLRKRALKILAQELTSLSAPLRMGLICPISTSDMNVNVASSSAKAPSDSNQVLDEIFFEPLVHNFSSEVARRWNVSKTNDDGHTANESEDIEPSSSRSLKSHISVLNLLTVEEGEEYEDVDSDDDDVHDRDEDNHEGSNMYDTEVNASMQNVDLDRPSNRSMAFPSPPSQPDPPMYRLHPERMEETSQSRRNHASSIPIIGSGHGSSSSAPNESEREASSLGNSLPHRSSINSNNFDNQQRTPSEEDGSSTAARAGSPVFSSNINAALNSSRMTPLAQDMDPISRFNNRPSPQVPWRRIFRTSNFSDTSTSSSNTEDEDMEDDENMNQDDEELEDEYDPADDIGDDVEDQADNDEGTLVSADAEENSEANSDTEDTSTQVTRSRPVISWRDRSSRPRFMSTFSASQPAVKRDSPAVCRRVTLQEAAETLFMLQRERPGSMNDTNIAPLIKQPSDSYLETQLLLAKCVSNLMRLFADLLFSDDSKKATDDVLDFRNIDHCGKRLTPLWSWLCCILDSTEAQLKFALARCQSSSQHQSSHRGVKRRQDGVIVRNDTTSRGNSIGNSNGNSSNLTSLNGKNEASQKESISYVMSIMRGNCDEHGDFSPFYDVNHLEFAAHLSDAFLYLLKASESYADRLRRKNSPIAEEASKIKAAGQRLLLREDAVGRHSMEEMSSTQSEHMVDKLTSDTNSRVDCQRFFRRSDSTLSLDLLPLDAITNKAANSLPLAGKPHLLRPDSKRSELFGCNDFFGEDCSLSRLQKRANSSIPIHFGLTSQWANVVYRDYSISNIHFDHEEKPLPGSHTFLGSVSSSAFILRWSSLLTTFGIYFGAPFNDGRIKSSILDIGGFPMKQERFQKEMERLLASTKQDFVHMIKRDRANTIIQTCKRLNSLNASRQKERQDTNELETTVDTGDLNAPIIVPPLCCNRIKVTFEGESGEGNGVMRGFFTAFAQAVLSESDLPDISCLHTEEKNKIDFSSQMRRSIRTSLLGSSGSTVRGSVPPPDDIESTGHDPTNHMRCVLETFCTNTPATDTARRSSRMIAALNPSLHSSILNHTGGNQELSGQVLQLLLQLPSAYSRQLMTNNTGLCERWITVATEHVLRDSNSSSTIRGAPPLQPQSDLLPVILNNLRMRQIRNVTSDTTISSSPTTLTSAPIISTSNTSSIQLPPQLSYAPFVANMPSESDYDDLLDQMLTMEPNPGHHHHHHVHHPHHHAVNSGSTNLLDPTAAVGFGLSSNQDLLTPYLQSAIRSSSSASPVASSEAANSGTAASGSTHSGRRHVSSVYVQLPRSVLNSSLMSYENAAVVVSDLSHLQSMQQESQATATASTSAGSSSMRNKASIINDRVALFWQPGIMGYYSPRMPVGCGSAELESRMNIYRNIGRVMGMALLMGEIFPLPLIRPVFKYILGRELRWHDLAFFDHTTYESLRQLLELASTPAGYATIESCALTFSFHPSLEEGGGSGSVVRELVDGGAHIAVTAQNIRLYVQLYAKARMRDIIIGPLENLRKGVFDVITPQSMEGLTAEDIRLILNGQSEIDIDQLILCTLFVDESGIRPSKPERISKIRLWFWNVVRSMDQSQRQDLVYFWTSSPTLPSSGNSFSPSPSITVRPPDDNRLPSANTCVYRIYLPYYSSRSILKERLLEAIRVKDFGFV